MGELLQLRLGAIAPLAAMVFCVLSAAGLALWLRPRDVRALRPRGPRTRGLATDLCYLMLSPITEALTRLSVTLAIAGCAWLAGGPLGPELLQGFGPVARQPGWLIVVEMLVLSDLVYYAVHRLAHGVPALWRLHAVHHSAEELGALSALRAHPLEVYVQVLCALPLFALGFPVEALAPLLPLVSLYALFIHSRFDVSLRWVSFFANSPRFHRVHHARDISDGTKNFAGLFPLFDVLFGTYALPDAAPAELGIDEPEMPDTFFAQLGYPLRPAVTAARGALERAGAAQPAGARKLAGLGLEHEALG